MPDSQPPQPIPTPQNHKNKFILLGILLILCFGAVFPADFSSAAPKGSATSTIVLTSPSIEKPKSIEKQKDVVIIIADVPKKKQISDLLPEEETTSLKDEQQQQQQQNDETATPVFSPSSSSSSNSKSGGHPDSADYCMEEPDKPLLRKRVISPPEKVYEYLQNIILMHMVSPSRYNLVPLIHRHYAPWFKHQIFTGPKNATVDGSGQESEPKSFTIEGHDVVAGTMQYVALANVINHVEALSKEERRTQNLPENPEGYMFLGDDLILHPWMLYGRNKKVVWCAGMGIAYVDNWRPVRPVKAMSVERKNQKQKWPFWFKGRVKMEQVLNDTGIDAEAKATIAKAYALTPESVKKESGYSVEGPPDRHVFYTIVDCFYVPAGRMALRWSKFAMITRKYWLHLETAIPSTLRMVSASYEVLRLQYYWGSISQEVCKRHRWSITMDGWHRCRHDHNVVHKLFGMNTTEMEKIAHDIQLSHAMGRLSGLDKSWNAKNANYEHSGFDKRALIPVSGKKK